MDKNEFMEYFERKHGLEKTSEELSPATPLDYEKREKSSDEYLYTAGDLTSVPVKKEKIVDYGEFFHTASNLDFNNKSEKKEYKNNISKTSKPANPDKNISSKEPLTYDDLMNMINQPLKNFVHEELHMDK